MNQTMKKIIQLNVLLTCAAFLTTNTYSQSFIRKPIPSFDNTSVAAFGMSAIDYDLDGLLDVFCVDLVGVERLFHNEGNGIFKLITIDQGGINGGTTDCGLSWGDYDNDGDPDLFIGTQLGENHFFRNNAKMGFSRVIEGSLVTDSLSSFDAVWVDYDNDGWLDILTCNLKSFNINARPGASNYFFHNNRDGSFTKIVDDVVSTDKGNTITGSFADYDNDGDVDLFAPDMGSNNYFYTNNGDGTFSSVSKGEIVEDTTVSLSAAWADYDNDGDLDIFVTNGVIEQKDMLYRNNGDGTFKRIFDSPPVENSASAWNGAWGDIDNDGDEDLYVSVWGGQNYFYINNGDGTFSQNDESSIISDSKSSNTSVSVWGDFDNDGDLDFITADCASARNLYYENTGNSNHWLRIKLIGTVSNKSAIGAQVRLKTTINGRSVRQMREISASNGFRSISNDFWPHFGLGDAQTIEYLEIRWPSGKVTRQTNVSTDQILTITE